MNVLDRSRAVRYKGRELVDELSQVRGEHKVLKRLITATASVALMATPALAAAQSSAAVSRAVNSSVVPASEEVSGNQLFGGGNAAVVIAALVAVGLGIYFLVKNGDNPPASP